MRTIKVFSWGSGCVRLNDDVDRDLIQMLHKSVRGRLPLILFFCLLISSSGMPPTARATLGEAAQQNKAISAADLLTRASLAEEKGDLATAAGLLVRYYDLYPLTARAEESLWRAAQLTKLDAQKKSDPDWEGERDIFRRYYTDFPNTSRGQEAYLEVGIANYHMQALREAQIYFNLFLEKYPGSSLVDKASYWKANTLDAIDRPLEAEEIYRKLMISGGQDIRSQAGITLAELYYKQGDYEKALDVCDAMVKEIPKDSTPYLELIRIEGVTRTHMPGKADILKGRQLLYLYLNLVEGTSRRHGALFELAESYYRSGMDDPAQKLYGQIISEGEPEQRVVVLSRFRQAQYLDDPKKKLGQWQKRGDLQDPAGDTPFQAVLANYDGDSIAQDARYGLFLRYMARKEYEQAFQVGKSYLQNEDNKRTEIQPSRNDIAGDILVRLVENLFERGEYEKVYELYVSQHNYVNDYKEGRLLYLVGRALEAMSLYEQASLVYYRAMELDLNDQEKADLYYHRAAVYIAEKDWPAAERLLEHLRIIYDGKKEAGEVYFLSGRMAEVRGNMENALDFYARAVKELTIPEKKSVYAEALLNCLVAMDRLQAAAANLDSYRQEKWLSGEAIQQWYSRIGESYLTHHKTKQAIRMFLAAVAEGTPQNSILAQKAHRHLGDIYAGQKKFVESEEHFQKAKEGEDALLRKVADERLRQNNIDRLLVDVGGVLKK